MGTDEFNNGGRWTSIPSKGIRKTPSRFMLKETGTGATLVWGPYVFTRLKNDMYFAFYFEVFISPLN